MQDKPVNWVRHRAVAEYLSLDLRTLRTLMDRTPGGVERPWVDVGLASSPRFRWESLQAAKTWLKAVAG